MGAAGTMIRGILSLLESFCPLAAIVADFAVGLIELLLDGFCPDAPGCPIMCVRLGFIVLISSFVIT